MKWTQKLLIGGTTLLGMCGQAMASTNVTETIDDSIDWMIALVPLFIVVSIVSLLLSVFTGLGRRVK